MYKRQLKDRGDHPGLVHVLSAMEACDAYEPWHDKPSHQTFLRHTSGKCLHYYFYWMDETLGLIYLRVPTWSPFRLQFYCNGHSWLAHSLTTAGIDYAMADNAFIRIDDWGRARHLADAFSPDTLHALLDRYAEQCCPIPVSYTHLDVYKRQLKRGPVPSLSSPASSKPAAVAAHPPGSTSAPSSPPLAKACSFPRFPPSRQTCRGVNDYAHRAL